MSRTRRLFFGLLPPTQATAIIERLVASFRIPSARVRWVERTNLHITVKFLGQVPVGTMEALSCIGEKVASTMTPFMLKAEGIGLFPSPENPKVMFVRIAGDLDAAFRLEKRVAQALQGLRLRSEQRHYLPHITIGRVRDAQAQPTMAKIADHYRQYFIAPVAVNELILFESTLCSTGAIYSRIATFALTG